MHPVKIYKYRDISNRTADLISTNKGWFSKASSLNDPYDMQLEFSVEKFIAEFESFADPMMVEEFEKSIFNYDSLVRHNYKTVVTQYTNSIKNQYGIFSLSARRDSLLMWSHYADSHSGVCLSYDTGSMVPIVGLHAVNYVDSYPKISWAEFFKAMSDREAHIANMRNLLATKSMDWKYEEEWRLIVDRGDRLHDIPFKLTEIILGAKVSDENKKLIIELAEDLKGVLVLQCSLDKSNYAVRFNRLI